MATAASEPRVSRVRRQRRRPIPGASSPCAWLNSHIMATADHHPGDLLPLLRDSMGSLNLMHCSTSMHRLSLMHESGEMPAAAMSEYADVFEGLLHIAASSIGGARFVWSAKTRGVTAALLRAVSVLGLDLDRALLSHVEVSLRGHLASMKAQEVANAVSSLVFFHAASPELLAEAEEVVRRGSDAGTFSDRCAAEIARCFLPRHWADSCSDGELKLKPRMARGLSVSSATTATSSTPDQEPSLLDVLLGANGIRNHFL
mmetsp:Transcript_2730/g.6425  ORF Transcript_2730/g.6425 Transcript_2730/m.6425 type:complete len:259 (+) Transcript_2730:60-836(+)